MERLNTIIIRLSKDHMACVDGLYQYDYGQRLIFKGVSLPFSYEVHFSNEQRGESKTVIGDSTGVDIPDEYLLTGDPVYFWVFLHDGNEDGETVYSGVIRVEKRARPTNMEPTPVQQDEIEQVLSALNQGVDLATQAAAAASEAAQILESPGTETTTLPAGEDALVTYDEGTFSFNVPRGFDGVSPIARVTKSGPVTTITIKDAQGTTSEEIYDGANAIDDSAGIGDLDKTWSANKLAREVQGQITDVRINNTSIVESGIANIPLANNRDAGVVKISGHDGLAINNGEIEIRGASKSDVKAGLEEYKPITPKQQDAAAFYGLAKASGDQTQASSLNAVGIYTDEAKSSIRTMFGAGNYTKPATGIPATDLAAGVIPDVSSKLDSSLKGAANGVAELDSQGTVPSGQLPSSVKNIAEYETSSSFPQTGESNKIYIATTTNKTYRWNGSAYAELTSDVDVSSKADKADTVLSTTLSRGREANSHVGYGSLAFGEHVEATGSYAIALGYSTEASGDNSVAEGWSSNAIGQSSHAEGSSTTAGGFASHAEGQYTNTYGSSSHVEGIGTTAYNFASHAEGINTKAGGDAVHAEGICTEMSGEAGHVGGAYNIPDSVDDFPEWTAGTSYSEGDIVWFDTEEEEIIYRKAYICITANNDQEFDDSKWDETNKRKYIEIIGNGSDEYTRSNARTLDWDGNEEISGQMKAASLNAGRFCTASGIASAANGLATNASGEYSHAEGTGTVASGRNSYAGGVGTVASGAQSHAEGAGTQATGWQSHAEGSGAHANGINSHAEGGGTIAAGDYSHVFGTTNVEDAEIIYDEWVAGTQYNKGDRVKITVDEEWGETFVYYYLCLVNNNDSIFDETKWRECQEGERKYVEIVGNGSDTFHRSNAYALDWLGNGHYAGDVYVDCNPDGSGGNKLPDENRVNALISQNVSNKADKTDTVLNTTLSRGRIANSTVGVGSFVFGNNLDASGDYSHAEGNGVANEVQYEYKSYDYENDEIDTDLVSGHTGANGNYAHMEGSYSCAAGQGSHAEGIETYSGGSGSHSEGQQSSAIGDYSHTEGYNCYAVSDCSHAEGRGTVAQEGHAEGYYTVSNGAGAHAEGYNTKALGNSHSEGRYTSATGTGSHAEGNYSEAKGSYTHTEGNHCSAQGYYSHAEGDYTVAKGSGSHAQGRGTIAAGDASHVFGKYNLEDGVDALNEWVSGTLYKVGDKVKVTSTSYGYTYTSGYECIEENQDEEFDQSKWSRWDGSTYVEIVGNGSSWERSNARTLDWNGNEELSGDLTVKKGTPDETSITGLKNDASVFQNVSGSTVSFCDAIPNKPIKDCAVHITANQNLNGYDYPWAPGGNRNLFNPEDQVSGYYISVYGVITEGQPDDMYSNNIAVEPGQKYALTFNKDGAGQFSYRVHGYNASNEWQGQISYATVSTTGFVQKKFTIPQDVCFVRFSHRDNISNIQFEKGENYTPFVPYSNICPINPRTECIIKNNNGLDPQDPEYVEDEYISNWSEYNCSNYGGTYFPSTGLVTIDWDFIDSYSGESLPGIWISDRDKYEEGTYPSTGAQVAYKLDDSYDCYVDGMEVFTRSGANNISATVGDIEFSYRCSLKEYVDQHHPVNDIQIKGNSIITNKIANIPTAGTSKLGLVMAGSGYGVKITDTGGNSDGRVMIDAAVPNQINNFSDQYRPITPKYLPEAVFHGLARAAGDTTQAASSNALGNYTSEASTAIQRMLGLWTPKFSINATCETDSAEFGQTQLVCNDVDLNIGEELVITVYQTNPSENDVIGGNNAGSILIKDTVNNSDITHNGYIVGSSPFMIRYKRFPNLLTVQTSWINDIANTSLLKVFPRLTEYVDKISWIKLSFDNSVVKAGTRIDVYVGRFI